MNILGIILLFLIPYLFFTTAPGESAKGPALLLWPLIYIVVQIVLLFMSRPAKGEKRAMFKVHLILFLAIVILTVLILWIFDDGQKRMREKSWISTFDLMMTFLR